MKNRHRVGKMIVLSLLAVAALMLFHIAQVPGDEGMWTLTSAPSTTPAAVWLHAQLGLA